VKYRGVLIASVLALTVAGCSSYEKAKFYARAVGVSQNTIDTVQGLTVQSCSYLPEINFVRELFATGKYSNIANAVYAVADDICAAATTQPLAEGTIPRKPPVIVIGKGRNRIVITVKGKFVK